MPANTFRKKPVVVEAVKWVGYFDIMPRQPVVGFDMLRLGLGLSTTVGQEGDMPMWLIEAIKQGVAEVGLNNHPSSPQGQYSVSLRLRTLETNKSGWFDVTPGDWVVKGVRGELYAVKPDIFKETYEEAVDNAPVDEAVYFTMRQNDEGVIRPWPSASLELAKSEARHAVEHGQSAFVSVCQEIFTYSRSYSVVERPAMKAAKGKIGET